MPSSRAGVASTPDQDSDNALDDSFSSGDLEFSDSDFDFAVSPRTASLQQDYMTHLRKLNILQNPEPFDAQRRYNRLGNVIPVFLQTRKPPVPCKTAAQFQAEISAKLEATVTRYGVQTSLRGREQICTSAGPSSISLSLKSRFSLNLNSDSHQFYQPKRSEGPEEVSTLETPCLDFERATSSSSDGSSLSKFQTPSLTRHQSSSSDFSVPSSESRANFF